VAVDLARELARRLDVSIEIVPFTSAGALADAATKGIWDVAFLGDEPQRAAQISFTPPYLEIEATYLVPAGSSLKTLGEVDREGIRITVPEKSAYDLYLSRNVKRAQLVRVQGTAAAFKYFVANKLEALAGLKPGLIESSAKLPGSRVLEGRFTVVQQAVGTPTGRPAGAQYLRDFVEDAKASGWVARAIERNGVRGVSVAPKSSR
jgi:polar amino acid transport system substrate-binding protein